MFGAVSSSSRIMKMPAMTTMMMMIEQVNLKPAQFQLTTARSFPRWLILRCRPSRRAVVFVQVLHITDYGCTHRKPFLQTVTRRGRGPVFELSAGMCLGLQGLISLDGDGGDDWAAGAGSEEMCCRIHRAWLARMSCSLRVYTWLTGYLVDGKIVGRRRRFNWRSFVEL